MSRDVINKVNSLKRINHFNLINLETSLNLLMCTMHHDIKSNNVFLNGNLRAKISNFSVARATARETSVVFIKYIMRSRARFLC
ncbi:hypothetical protein NC651_003753 [Populus alba x Populus x berolinensis]|nr:hypothetical protein NC651_003753 [Populus alba x Populus x berolinensis]